MASLQDQSNVTALQSLSDSIASMVEKVGASTVGVRARGRHALGCGLVWRPGILITAAHIFGRAPATAVAITARHAGADLALVGTDAPTDLAVFRLPDEELPAVAVSTASEIRAGQLALLVGRAQGADVTARVAVIHRVSGAWQTWLGGRIDRLIRLDASLHGGLSGGPVADAAGGVFGMATSALSRTDAIAVPESTISRVVDDLLARGHVTRAFLGISAQPAFAPGAGAPGAAAASPAVPGLLVTAMTPDGPAARAGLLVGDIVVDVGEQRAASVAELREALAGHIGKIVRLALIRGGAPAQVDVTVGQWPIEARAC
ncbi:MAG TPA: S1C family serine protease [Burkholderiaceae bacterium]